jgi:hypothetical protein
MALQFPRFGEFHMLDLEVRDKPKMSPDCFGCHPSFGNISKTSMANGVKR